MSSASGLARSGSLALLADEKIEFAPIVATGGEPPSEAATPLGRNKALNSAWDLSTDGGWQWRRTGGNFE